MKRLAWAALLLCACKSAPEAAPGAAAEDATLYYPLAVGNSWTYAQRGADKEETIQIVGRDGPWFLDDHRGRLRYEKDGVRDGDRYLLRSPLSPGAKWKAVDNLVVQSFEVVSMDASAVTRAGTFTRCAVVRNEQPLAKGGKFVTEWTYARKVGMVQLVTSTVDAKGHQQEQTRLQLVAYRVGQ
ncbi:MAG TPA: hypothetical protein VMK66_09410 [Myxococcales bacterium]|nr:hypothetical protein [Myxococcales bacterium]